MRTVLLIRKRGLQDHKQGNVIIIHATDVHIRYCVAICLPRSGGD